MLTPDEQEIFHAARRIETPDAREAYLASTCGEDPALRARIEALLRVHDEDRNFLRLPADGLRLRPVSPPGDGPGSTVGPYKLLEQIGEGGCGVVFLAEQRYPVCRKVALKLIKPGMDTKQVIARFEAERQALALMDHPNIAHVLEGGETSSGRPYFVMELVRGIPVTDFCDRNHFNVRQRLDLFVSLCRAVQHAHTKGIIHRDLKPSNVLVTLHDGVPVVKVIDFGIAKALGQKLTDKTLFTSFVQMVGTPLYMSPEQAEMSGLDVDTRSDVYSLGVMLYELLTGSTPFDRERLRTCAFDEMRRIIREEEPARPSSRISTLPKAATVSTNRGSDPRQLSRLVRGELDWIVMKCLEKDRTRRYETANGLARDTQRYLNEETVEACPPSASYRLRKLARRHKGPVLAGAIIVLLLVAGVIGTSIGMVRAERRAEGERQAKDTAEKRLGMIEKGVDLLGYMFADLDPMAEEKEGRPLRAILGDRLDQTAAALAGEAVGDPLVVAKLQDRLGQTYLGLGHATRAEAQFTKALAARQAHLDSDDPLTLTSMHNQALAFEAGGKRIEAIQRFELVREARVKVLGADDLDTLSTLNELANAYRKTGKPAQAIPLLKQVLEGRRKQLGEDDDHTLASLQSLAQAYSSARKHSEAIALALKVRDARVKKHGEGHPQAIDALAHLASVYQAGYKMPQALALFEQSRDSIELKLGIYHPQTLRIMYGLATMYRAYRKTPRAIALLELVRERQMMIQGGQHPATINTLNSLGLAYLDAKDLGKAQPLFLQAALGVEKLGYAHDFAGQIVNNLSRCHEKLQQYDKAEVWRRKWLAVAKEKDGPGSVEYAGVQGLASLGWNLLQQQKYAEAEPILRESLPILQKQEPNVFETFQTQSRLGGALLGQKRYADAEPHIVQGYQGMKEREKGRGSNFYGPSPAQEMAEAIERLVQLHEARGNTPEVDRWRKELVDVATKQKN